MKKCLIVLVLFPFVLFSQRYFTLQDIWVTGKYNSKPVKGFNALKNGLTYADFSSSENGAVNVCEFDLKTQSKTKELFSGNDLNFNGAFLDIYTYQFSPDEKKVLLYANAEPIYRHSIKANYYIYLIERKLCLSLSETGKQQFPTFSPDCKKVAYVVNNNLYIKNLEDGLETAVTSDGELNKTKNGWGDWVYEEEFSKMDYFSWSADNQFLAYIKFDESKVKEYTLDYYMGDLYPQKVSYKYPKAGEANSVVSLHIYNVKTGKTTKAELGTETDIYLPRLQFTNDEKALCVQRLNRLQNKLEYIFVDAISGNSKVIHTEESATYVDVNDDLTFVRNDGFIISSEKDGYNHLYYYDLEGKLITQITTGNWDVTQFKGFDPSSKTVFYVSTENGAINRDVYSIKLDGKNKKRLSTRDGFSDITLTNGNKFYTLSNSSAARPKRTELYSIDGKLVKVLEDNTTLLQNLQGIKLSKKEFFQFTTSEGVSLNAWMMKPQVFDSTKKYPVYMYGYGGPGSVLCKNSWTDSEYYWHNILTQQGYIVVCVDGRGTAGRGREFKHSTYLQLGKLEVIDQIEAAKYFGNLKYVDKSRIGFQGWSYGGYMASLLICKGSDVIKAAIAVAPVTNWKYYDNIYTERFLRKPSENIRGYEENSPINHVKQIKGKFLLIHGSCDDNVHMQNSMELANALVTNNIPFDYMIYPNKDHGIRDKQAGGFTRLHIYSKILKFVTDNL